MGPPGSTALAVRRAPPKVPKPEWHAPWKLSAVVAGHLGWVRAIAFDPTNEWFVTGSADRTIKVRAGRAREGERGGKRGGAGDKQGRAQASVSVGRGGGSGGWGWVCLSS